MCMGSECQAGDDEATVLRTHPAIWHARIYRDLGGGVGRQSGDKSMAEPST